MQKNSGTKDTMNVQKAKGGFNKSYGPGAKPHKVSPTPKKG